MVDGRDTNLRRKLAFRHEEFLNSPGTTGKAVTRERIDRCPLPKKVDGTGALKSTKSDKVVTFVKGEFQFEDLVVCREVWLVDDRLRTSDGHARLVLMSAAS
jgi:hypothetical protein